MTDIHLTKLAAARRQLCAAIRMFFAGEDELAVHTVASAGYRIVTDLKSKRGRDEASDYYLTSIFYVVQEYCRGTLPGYFTEDQEAMERISTWAEQLPMITATSKYEDISASATPDLVKQFWGERTKVANFLKHADRDAADHISMDEVDNVSLLMLALGSYLDVDNGGLGNEGLVLWVFSHVNSGDVESLPEDWQELASRMEPLSHDARLKICSEWLKETESLNSVVPPSVHLSSRQS